MPVSDTVFKALKPRPIEEIASAIQDGDLLLCSGDDAFSRLIGWATNSPWTHIAIACRWSEIGRVMVFESVEKIGVRAVPLTTFVSQNSAGVRPYPGRIVLARHARMAEALAKAGSRAATALADKAVDRLGDRFAPAEIAKIGLRIVLGAAHIRLPPSLGPKNEFICSEYVGRCLEALDIQIPWDGRGFVAPSDFAACPEVFPLAQIQTRPAPARSARGRKAGPSRAPKRAPSPARAPQIGAASRVAAPHNPGPGQP